jgi:hypothetical protein
MKYILCTLITFMGYQSLYLMDPQDDLRTCIFQCFLERNYTNNYGNNCIEVCQTIYKDRMKKIKTVSQQKKNEARFQKHTLAMTAHKF